VKHAFHEMSVLSMETIILCTWSGIQSWSYRPPGLCPPRKWWKNLFLIWWEDGAYRFATRDEGRHKGPTTSVWDPNHDGSLIYFTFIFVGVEGRRIYIASGWSWTRDFWQRSSTPRTPDHCTKNSYEILVGTTHMGDQVVDGRTIWKLILR